MLNLHPVFLPSAVAIAISLGSLMSGSMQSASASQTRAPAKPTLPQPQQVGLKFKPPNRGAPPATAGGATRGICQNRSLTLVPILPPGQFGLTTTERPSFFVYIPQTGVKTGEFLLLGSGDSEILYQKTFSIPSTPTIVRFDLPASAPALKPGTTYHWYVSVVCNPAQPGVNPTTEGWVERITPSSALAKTLSTAKPSERPHLFAEAGIWYETLTSLDNQRRQSPKNTALTKDWQELLQSVRLEAIQTAPVVIVKPDQQP